MTIFKLASLVVLTTLALLYASMGSCAATVSNPNDRTLTSSPDSGASTTAAATSTLTSSSSTTTAKKVLFTGFGLIDADSGTKVLDLKNGTVVDASQWSSRLSINASFVNNTSTTTIGSVVFNHSRNRKNHVENYAWYSLCGNNGGTIFLPCSNLAQNGNHSVTATAYTQRNGQGAVIMGTPYTVHFSIINVDVRPPTISSLNLSASALNFTKDEAIDVKVTVVVQDDISGFASGFLEVIHEGGLSNSIQSFVSVYDLPPQPAVDAQQRITTVVFTLSFDANSPPGAYALQLSLTDRAGKLAVYNATQLARRKLSSTIVVVNAGYDGTPPALLNFTVLSATTVNVTLAPALVKMQLVIRDAGSGIGGLTVSIVHQDDASNEFPELRETIIFDEPLVAGRDGTPPALVNVTLVVPQYVLPGRYWIDVFIGDAEKNGKAYTRDELASAKYPSSIKVFNSVRDSTPPQLLNFGFVAPIPQNLTMGSVVAARATVWDNVSGVSAMLVSATCDLQDDGFSYLEATVDYDFVLGPIVNKKLDVKVAFPISRSTRPGQYKISMIMFDGAGNVAELDSDGLNALKLPNSFDIVNAAYNGNPPVLVKTELLSPSTVNVTGAPGVLKLRLTVRDDQDFQNGTVFLERSDGEIFFRTLSRVNFAPALPIAAGKAAVFIVNLPISQFIKDGQYEIGARLQDAAGNLAELVLDLPPITVVNSNEDITPPTLVSLTSRSSMELNVSSSSATVDFEVVVRDSLSGVANWMFSVLNANNQMFESKAGSFKVPKSSEQQGNVAFNVSFTFARLARKGVYPLDLVVSDAACQELQLFGDNLIRRGFPGKIVVV